MPTDIYSLPVQDDNIDKMQTLDFDLKAYMPVLATAYGEAFGMSREFKIHVLSSILNRAETGKEEFGAQNAQISEVLRKGYYAYSKQSPKYKEAINQKFPDKMSENDFKEFPALMSGILKGVIKRSDAMYFLTDKEAKNQSWSKNLKVIDRREGFNFYNNENVGTKKSPKKLAAMR